MIMKLKARCRMTLHHIKAKTPLTTPKLSIQAYMFPIFLPNRPSWM
jgi:hypothetical protein